ncbi:N-acetyltransferase [Neisseria sp. N95_16]|uniref:GNAT family N-acetyltransferase n=1 Tax=Neisseria brasiliensis TaxID=2666100 RepID=A0A5Q3S2F5_9NEIS|nr:MULTISPECIES: GNAT family protein [Neisseria]MRN38174.1 GNAT family N-acetyltransferase [Neisseria brasiliensis]PJO09081.1 N-acetyltransferase [Neisseria sp. N95_16]PJO77306.1 N-acetyltransferase [Neisseria sp. N177_16]QGL25174.1 GNAT family N-acetyltransferase [Neisseria brasiliensis]
MPINQFNQPIGKSLPDYTTGSYPEVTLLSGKFCRLEKLSAAKHGADLYEVYAVEHSPMRNWTYLPIFPMADHVEFDELMAGYEASADPYFFAIIDTASNRAVGSLSLMRIDTANRVIEVGWVVYSDALKRTRIATEAQYLLAKYVFETLKYRRYEWKCDALNELSRKAALRLGFQFEGIFRQAAVYKGRSRDTAWFSMIDSEWSQSKARFERWLDDTNFDEQGNQRVSLSEI